MRVTENGIHIWEHYNEACSNFGFDVDAILQHAASLKWPDKDLLDCLHYGFDYLLDNTLPVSTFSQAKEFFAQVAKEIEKGWLSDPQRIPRFIPFRVLPSSIIEKIEGGFRLVWDASWPHRNSRFGALCLSNGTYFLLDANSFTDIPDEYTFEWPSIGL